MYHLAEDAPAPTVGMWGSCFPCCCPCDATKIPAWILTTLTTSSGWGIIFLLAIGGFVLGTGIAIGKGWEGAGMTTASLVALGIGSIFWALKWWREWSTEHVALNNIRNKQLSRALSFVGQSLSSVARSVARRLSGGGGDGDATITSQAAVQSQVCEVLSPFQTNLSLLK